MALTKITVVFLVIGLVLGVIGGYGVGFTIYQPRITRLESDLLSSQNQVVSLNATLIEARSEIASLNASLTDARSQVASLNASLTDARSQVASLNATLQSLQMKLSSINATTPKLDKDRRLIEMLNKPFPESYAAQLLWMQDVLKAAKEVDPRLGPLWDNATRDWENLVDFIDLEPENVYTTEWVDWVLQYLYLRYLYNVSSGKFSDLFYVIVIEDINNTIQAVQ